MIHGEIDILVSLANEVISIRGADNFTIEHRDGSGYTMLFVDKLSSTGYPMMINVERPNLIDLEFIEELLDELVSGETQWS